MSLTHWRRLTVALALVAGCGCGRQGPIEVDDRPLSSMRRPPPAGTPEACRARAQLWLDFMRVYRDEPLDGGPLAGLAAELDRPFVEWAEEQTRRCIERLSPRPDAAPDAPPVDAG